VVPSLTQSTALAPAAEDRSRGDELARVLVGVAAVVFPLLYFVSDVIETVHGDFSTFRLVLTYLGESAIPLFVLGLLAAGVSVYWGLGGTALLNTVGGSLGQAGHARQAGALAAVCAADCRSAGVGLARLPVGPVVPGLGPACRSRAVAGTTRKLGDARARP
jgi:hypothetical protein